MKRLFLLFVPLVFFFGCEKDNADASASPSNNQSVSIDCSNNVFDIGPDEYEIDSSVLWEDCDSYVYDEVLGSGKGGDCSYMICLAGPGVDVSYYGTSGEGDIMVFDFYGIDIESGLSGTYPIEDYEDGDCSVRMFLDAAWDDGYMDYVNALYMESESGQVTINFSNNNLDIDFEFLTTSGSEVTGCYSGNLDEFMYY